MDKTIMISGKPVIFRKTAGTALRYKRQFGRELDNDLIKIYDLFPILQDMTQKKEENKQDKPKNPDQPDEQTIALAKAVLGVETEWMYDIAYIMAQQADPAIRDEIEWLDSFDDLNIMELFLQLMPLIKKEQQVSPKNA